MSELDRSVVIGLAGGQNITITEGGADFNLTTLDTELRLSITPRTFVHNNQTEAPAQIVVITQDGLTAAAEVNEDGNVVISYTGQPK